MTSFSSMSLYALTVKQPTATQDALSGDFLGNGKQQILTASGSRLAILEVSRRQKGFQELYSQDVFGIIRRIAKFRIAGGTKGMSILRPRYKQYSDFQSTRHLRAPSSLRPRWTGL
jgi:splicing factor 3B subunit 3